MVRSRQIGFAVITTAYFGFWLWAFWPSIVFAAKASTLAGLQFLAFPIALGVAVALLMPLPEQSRWGWRRRLVFGALVALLLGLAAFVYFGLMIA